MTSPARRRSGSHYTPRELTQPIVETTLRPVLEALGERPTPQQILDLKVCDPAMGSGAFLVEACRQLAERLVRAWEVHASMPKVPPDEEPLLHARRLVAQKCLYGVDKNPFAVNLAKLSLWLVTLARDHAFTFLDHALKHGDSLVGLTRRQILAFDWRADPDPQLGAFEQRLEKDVAEALGWRETLQGLGEANYDDRRDAWWEAENALADVRLIGDLVVAAFFGAEKKKGREELRNRYREMSEAWREGSIDRGDLVGIVDELRQGERPVPPLHWEIEFPEVFGRGNPGFDAMVGNPPFAGKNTTINGNALGYLDWLKTVHAESHGNADLVAHFYRRAFGLLRWEDPTQRRKDAEAQRGGCMGLIATNTIGQGDTRGTGLQWICQHGGTICAAQRRLRWPGLAAVVVSVVQVSRGPHLTQRRTEAQKRAQSGAVLDGKPVERITAFLFHGGGHSNPHLLSANVGKSFQGAIVLGMGFTFDDTDKKGVASSLAEMHRLIEKDPRNAERILPYIGGQEINSSPTHAHHRYVINFESMSEIEARQWPDLMAIVEERVKPERLKDNRASYRKWWWQYAEKRSDLGNSTAGLERLLVICRHQPQWVVASLPSGAAFAESVIVFSLDGRQALATLQSRPHELWARFFGSSMKDDLRYTPSDCFETFPFPPGAFAPSRLCAFAPLR